MQNGSRFDCASGETFNVFESGKMSFQRNQNTQLAKDVKALYDGRIEASTPVRRVEVPLAAAIPAAHARPVFIVVCFRQACGDPWNSRLVGWWIWLLPPILWRLFSNAPPNVAFGLGQKSQREAPMQTGFGQKAMSSAAKGGN